VNFVISPGRVLVVDSFGSVNSWCTSRVQI
jgi:hypothetical protein